jgi:phospholipid transport system substrate-binding protein
MRLSLFAASLVLVITQAAAEAPYPAGGSPYEPGYAPAPATPDQVIRRGLDRLTGFLMGAQNPHPETIRVFLEREIAPHFDFAYMARWSAGPMYRRMTPEQHGRMAGLLEGMFLSALARNLGTYSRPLPRVDVFPTRTAASGSQATVHARFISANGTLSRLNFRFYWSDHGWRIFDVSANGASAVAYYRSYFGDMFRRYGPDAVLR